MDKNKKLFVRPPQDPRFEHLRILKWNVRKKPTPEHGKYSIRFTLIMDETIPYSIVKKADSRQSLLLWNTEML